MEWMHDVFWYNGKFLGVTWYAWKLVGWTGNLLFFSRFIVQWWATERSRRVVVPPLFWWLSLAGSFCLLAYGVYRRDSVFIFAYVFTWIPYIRNLMIGRQVARRHHTCGHCRGENGPGARFCQSCGAGLGAGQKNP